MLGLISSCTGAFSKHSQKWHFYPPIGVQLSLYGNKLRQVEGNSPSPVRGSIFYWLFVIWYIFSIFPFSELLKYSAADCKVRHHTVGNNLIGFNGQFFSFFVNFVFALLLLHVTLCTMRRPQKNDYCSLHHLYHELRPEKTFLQIRYITNQAVQPQKIAWNFR